MNKGKVLVQDWTEKIMAEDRPSERMLGYKEGEGRQKGIILQKKKKWPGNTTAATYQHSEQECKWAPMQM